ncbi:SlyX family protein [Azohydromonas lata]|uniref:SlyX family protein n=1 Tax=Azohydromonas lata TaxID=45677 RepID=A0ABU5IKE1_9BURK|nr:SlyX family protein [Azohydromonas lata]MDZ5459329.1 SlyX family protein [Azohydromonas lata]
MDQDDTERRLEALEIKASFAEDLLDELNATVARQQMQILHLMQQLRALQEQLPSAGAAPRSLRDELPPHY